MTTLHNIRTRQRLTSDEERTLNDAVARARWAQLEREAAARRARAWWWVSLIAVTLLGVLLGLGLSWWSLR